LYICVNVHNKKSILFFQRNGTTKAVRMGETAVSGIAAAATKGTRKSTSIKSQEPESQYRTITVGE
jgi:hypothetical protein